MFCKCFATVVVRGGNRNKFTATGAAHVALTNYSLGKMIRRETL